MFGESKNRHSLSENGSSSDLFSKTTSPKVSNSNSGQLRHYGNADSEFPFENNNSIFDHSSTSLLKYKRNNSKQSKGCKRNYRSMSKPEPIGLMAKKIRVKKRDLVSMSRRSSIRLKGQATPLYFPPLRFRLKRAHQLKESGEFSVPESSVERKKRGRPKREKVETFRENDDEMASKPDEFKVKKLHRMKKVSRKVIENVKNVEIQAETPPNENDLLAKPPNLMENDEKETSPDLKPKRRIWNIPRNKLPSFTIVNNPLLKPSNGKDIKSLAGLRHNQAFVSSGIPVYACRICGKQFARKLSVRGHMKSHSKLFEYKHKGVKKTTFILESPKRSSTIPTKEHKATQPVEKLISTTSFVCDICGRIFNHKMGIRGHKKSHSSLMMAKRREALLNEAKVRNDFSDRGQLNCISLGKSLNTRSRAGNFDDIIFSEVNEQTEYPIWKKEVRIGEDFQVTDFPIPDMLINFQLREDLIWNAEYTVPQVDEYLKLSDSPLTKFGGRNLEYALHILFRCQGNIWDALTILIEGKNIIAEDDPIFIYNFTGLAFWTLEERNGFKTAWMKYGKDFSQIQKYIVSKSLNQVVEFYYRWTIECPDEYKKYSRTVSSRKYLQTVSCTSIDSTSNDTPNDDNEEVDKNTEMPEETPIESTENVEGELKEVILNPVKKTRPFVLPPPMGPPTRPHKSLKELVSSYQDRKEIKAQAGGGRRTNRDVNTQKIVTVVRKERKQMHFPHKRVWNKQLHTTRKARHYSKRIAQKVNDDSRTKYPSKATMLEGIPVLKPVPNSTHKRIINRIGSFPCKKCKRIFNRIKSLNAHMKCHSIRAGKSHNSAAVQNLSPALNTD